MYQLRKICTTGKSMWGDNSLVPLQFVCSVFRSVLNHVVESVPVRFVRSVKYFSRLALTRNSPGVDNKAHKNKRIAGYDKTRVVASQDLQSGSGSVVPVPEKAISHSSLP